MRILLDENLPKRLKSDLAAHDVRTVRDMGWNGKRNGVLLSLMVEEGIDLFITLDKSLRYQQAVDKFNVRIILLLAISNEYAILQPLMPPVLEYLASGRIEGFLEIKEFR